MDDRPLNLRIRDGLIFIEADGNLQPADPHEIMRMFEIVAAHVASLRSERDEARAMIQSADEKLSDAAKRVGFNFGCDTPDALAEEVLSLRAERDKLRKVLKEAREYVATFPTRNVVSIAIRSYSLARIDAAIAAATGREA